MHGLAAAAFALMYSLGGSAMALLGGHAHMTSALLSGLFTPLPLVITKSKQPQMGQILANPSPGSADVMCTCPPQVRCTPSGGGT